MKSLEILELLNKNEIEKLKEKLLQEIKLQDAPTASTKANFKKVANYLKKKCERRPVLQGCAFVDDMQILTDSYFMAFLVHDDFNPLLKDETAGYPNTKWIKDSITKNCNTIKEISSDDLLNEFKNLKAESIANGDHLIKFDWMPQYLDIKIVEIAFASINLTKGDILTVKYNNADVLKAINIEKNNGSNCIILPVKKYLKEGY